MTIKRRINLSFFVIGIFFGLNLIVYFWNGHRQSISADSLRRATSRQLLFSDIQQEINAYQRQIALLGQTMSDAGGSTGGGAAESEISQFKEQLHKTSNKIRELETLADADVRPQITAFASDFDALSASWTAFYQNFGVNTPAAIMELALRGDPLGTRMIQETLPQLRSADRARADLVTRRFFSESALSERINLGSFFLSTAIAMIIGWIVMQHVVNGLNKLKDGAAKIGKRMLDFRIDIRSRDELGDLAVAFNEMASNLSDAREELNRRHEELEIEKRHAETLLLNILPARAAKELQEKGSVDPSYFADATIMFTDFVGFTLSTEKLAAEDLVHMLHDYFTAFDRISRRYGLEKLKTIGDSYMWHQRPAGADALPSGRHCDGCVRDGAGCRGARPRQQVGGLESAHRNSHRPRGRGCRRDRQIRFRYLGRFGELQFAHGIVRRAQQDQHVRANARPREGLFRMRAPGQGSNQGQTRGRHVFRQRDSPQSAGSARHFPPARLRAPVQDLF